MQSIDDFLDYLEQRLKGTKAELDRIPWEKRSTAKALVLEEMYHSLQGCVLEVGYFQATVDESRTGYGGRAPHGDQV